MKIIVKYIMLLLIAILITSCGRIGEEEANIKIYYPTRDHLDLEKIVIEGYKPNEYTLDVATKLIKGQPKDRSINSILFGGVKLRTAVGKKDLVEVDLSSEFYNLSIEESLIMRAAIVRAYTEVNNYNKVEFFVNGEPYKSNDGKTVYTPLDFFVLNDHDGREKQRANVIFYFLDKKQKKLIKNIRTIQYTKDELELNTVRELLRGPINDKEVLENIFPLSTTVYEAKTVDGVCTVKLNDGISALSTEKEIELAVYSIVNTLSSIPGINNVQIVTDDENGIKFENKRLYTKPLEKNDSEKIVVVPK